MANQDLQTALDSAIGTFVGLMFVEVIVKPVAIRVGKYLVQTADKRLKWLPDFLYKSDRNG